LRNAASLGGDADTMAGMSGSIAEALSRLEPEFMETSECFFERFSAAPNYWNVTPDHKH